MNPQLIIAALIAAAGFGSAWKLQSLRMDARENDYAQQALVNERSAATSAIRRTEAFIAATSAATVRATALRRDADAASAGLIGLSHAADTALRDSAASLDACTVTATTFRELFTDSTERYTMLAATASRHVNDIQALKDAWPK